MNEKATGLSLCVLVLAACGSWGCGPNDGQRQAFRVLADGQPAVIAETITIQWPAGQPVGIVGGIAVCGPIAYLTAPVVGTVHQVDLDTGRATGSIGRRGQGPGEFQLPGMPAADCVRNLLHVVEVPFRVSTFSIPDGRFVRRRRGDPAFSNAPGGRALLSAGGGHLYAPGIWGLDFGAIPDGEFYRDTRLVAELSLADNTSRPLFTPTTADCRSGDAECLKFTFDRTGTGEDAGWVYAQGAGATVGIAAADGTLVRTFEMASPRFLRDGRRLAPGLGPAVTTEWGLTNSTLSDAYAFGDHIAVVHRHNATKWDPTGATGVEFNVFMNVFDAGGRGLIADLSLPDMPIGRGDDLIYVVDYGPAGRGADGIDSIRLLGVSVEESLRAYGVDTGLH